MKIPPTKNYLPPAKYDVSHLFTKTKSTGQHIISCEDPLFIRGWPHLCFNITDKGQTQPSECGQQRTLNIVHAQTAAQQQSLEIMMPGCP